MSRSDMTLWQRLTTSDPAYMARSTPESQRKERFVAFVIGAIALFLAFGVAALDEVLQPVCARSSISHYFLEPFAGTFFVMALTFVGAFMIAYAGENRWDGGIATLGGVGALILAFFPTDGLGCAEGQMMDLRPALTITVPSGFTADDAAAAGSESYPDFVEVRDIAVGDGDELGAVKLAISNEWLQLGHFVGAGVLFVALLYFVLIAFPRKDEDDYVNGALKAIKRMRNAFYYAFGTIMAFGIVMVVFSGAAWAEAVGAAMAASIAPLPFTNPDFADVARPVYHGEMLALSAFGLSWLLKGRFWLR